MWAAVAGSLQAASEICGAGLRSANYVLHHAFRRARNVERRFLFGGQTVPIFMVLGRRCSPWRWVMVLDESKFPAMPYGICYTPAGTKVVLFDGI